MMDTYQGGTRPYLRSVVIITMGGILSLMHVLHGTSVIIQRMRRRRFLRQDLRRLDSRLLKDAGLRYEDLAAEAFKPFWRP